MLLLGVGGGWLHFDVPGMALGMIGGALFLPLVWKPMALADVATALYSNLRMIRRLSQIGGTMNQAIVQTCVGTIGCPRMVRSPERGSCLYQCCQYVREP